MSHLPIMPVTWPASRMNSAMVCVVFGYGQAP
jgi:hypothetical protein